MARSRNFLEGASMPETDPTRIHVRHVVAFLSKTGNTIQQTNVLSPADLNALLESFINGDMDGHKYRIVSSHPIGENPDGYGFTYLLVQVNG